MMVFLIVHRKCTLKRGYTKKMISRFTNNSVAKKYMVFAEN